MKLSKTSTYASLALGYLATSDRPGPIQARHIASHLGIPTDSALKILQTLARHQLIRSQLGRTGGYELHRPADTISLLHVVEAIDGPLVSQLPCGEVDGTLKAEFLLLQSACDQVTGQLRRELSCHSIADLAHPLALAG